MYHSVEISIGVSRASFSIYSTTTHICIGITCVIKDLVIWIRRSRVLCPQVVPVWEGPGRVPGHQETGLPSVLLSLLFRSVRHPVQRHGSTTGKPGVLLSQSPPYASHAIVGISILRYHRHHHQPHSHLHCHHEGCSACTRSPSRGRSLKQTWHILRMAKVHDI